MLVCECIDKLVIPKHSLTCSLPWPAISLSRTNTYTNVDEFMEVLSWTGKFSLLIDGSLVLKAVVSYALGRLGGLESLGGLEGLGSRGSLGSLGSLGVRGGLGGLGGFGGLGKPPGGV